MDMRVGKVILGQKIITKNYNMKYFIYLLTIIFFISCKERTNNSNYNTLNSKNLSSNLDEQLDKLLHCDKFDIREGYYQIPDYGCIYNPTINNNLGNANVLLFPRNNQFNTFEIDKKCNGDYECLKKIYSDIYNLSISELKENFNALIFIENKEYLENTPNLDKPYNAKTPYIINSYQLENGKWSKGKQFNVNNEENEIEIWQNNLINDFIVDTKIVLNNKPETLSPENNISADWYGKYSSFFSYGQIGGDNAGWILEIDISKDNIKATGDGYQISFSDLLTAKEEGDKLILYHLKNINGYKLGEKMDPEFVLIKKGNIFFINSNWIDKDIITKPKSLGYEITKD